MSQDLHCECGVAAMYWLAEAPEAEDRPDRNAGPVDTTPLVPGSRVAFISPYHPALRIFLENVNTRLLRLPSSSAPAIG